MVDREARDKTAEFLRHVAAGIVTETDVMRFDETLRTKDKAVLDSLFEALELPFDHRTERPILDDSSRKAICRTILFLQTDCEYSWSTPWLGATVVPLVCYAVYCYYLPRTWEWLCRYIESGLLSFFGGLILTLVPTILWGSLASKLISLYQSWQDSRSGGEGELWPFFHREDYEEALKHPKLLCGKKAA